MNVAVEDRFEPVEPIHIRRETRQGVGIAAQRADERLQTVGEQAGDVDPPRVAVHLGGRVELERLVFDVEMQAGEGLLVALEERWRLATGDPIQRGDPLLPIEDQHSDSGSPSRLSPYRCAVRLGLPGQQATYRIVTVERPHEATDLITVPDVAPLELRQQDAPGVDLEQDRCQLRHDPSPESAQATQAEHASDALHW